MLTADRTVDLFDRIYRFAGGKDTDVIFQQVRSSLTRFANNTIHQNVSEESTLVSVRLTFDGKTARATTNKLDDDSLKRAVEAAERLTRVQEPNPDLLPMLTPDEAKQLDSHSEQKVNRYFESTSGTTPDDRASAVAKIVGVAKKNGLVTAGTFSTCETYEAIMNSKGVHAEHRQSSSEISITILADHLASSGWQKANYPDVRLQEPERLAEIGAEKALKSANPKEIAPGKYTVILEPAAVLDLLGFMFYDFGAQAVLDERSFLTDRLGKKVFGEGIHISDDVYHPLQSGAPFDGEGVPRQPVSLVEKGTAANLVYSRASAVKMKASERGKTMGAIRSTGHGFPLPNEIGDAPMNIVMQGAPEGQAKTVDEMIASTERGILVTRLWYIREVEPYEKMLTGMTRDGTFLIEGGKIKHGLRNFRFNQGLVEMLNNVEAMGREVRASGEESFDMVVPPMKVRGFNFTEVTKF
jgi:PmbA protein